MMQSLLAWALAHPDDALIAVGVVGSAVATAWKSVPAEARARVEREHPRLANVMRLLAAVFVDGAKAASVLLAIARGTAKPPARTAYLPDLRHQLDTTPLPISTEAPRPAGDYRDTLPPPDPTDPETPSAKARR